MRADTSAIHAFGDIYVRHAAALQAVHAALAAAYPATDALGSAGAGFTRALIEAMRAHAERIAGLAGVVSDAGAAAHANATAYAAADSGAGRSIAEVGG